jgi:hypothetical protein
MKSRFTVVVSVAFAMLASSALCGCGSSDSKGTSGDPQDFVPLCNSSGLTCSTDTSPPSMVGQYAGQGQTTQTTNSLWNVGDMNTFNADITQQSGGTVAGTFDMGSLHLDIKAGQIRGTAQGFTIYGTDVVSQDGCNTEVEAVIVGGPAASGAASLLSGELALSFTHNISGSGCTADQVNGYPGTGAVFSYSASPVE